MKNKLVILMVILLFILCGCSQQQKADVAPVVESQWPSSDKQIHTYKEFPLTSDESNVAAEYPQLVFAHVALDDVFLYEIRPEAAINAPMAIFLHEQGTNKDECLEMAFSCAQAGYFCVLMDLPGHGERLSTQTLQAIEVVTEGSADIDLILEFYRLSRYADSSRFGLLGISMGGSVAYHYAAFGEKMPALLLVCSAEADFAELYDKGSLVQGKEQPSTWDAETFRAYCKTCNPMDHLDRLCEIPMLSIYGSQDSVVNIDSIHSLAERMSAAGKARFMFLEHENHEVTKYLQPYILPMLGQCLK